MNLDSAVEALNEKERRYPLLEKHMHEHRKLNSFTYILIHLRPAIKAELAQDGATLMTRLLSDVYYYQLKPSALPEFSSMGRSSRAEGTKSPGGPLKKLKGSSSGAQASSGKSSSSPLEASKVDIAVTFNRNNAARSYTSVLLEQLDKCMEGHYLNKAVGEPFIAQLEVDDPTYVPMEDESEVTLRVRRTHVSYVDGERRSRPSHGPSSACLMLCRLLHSQGSSVTWWRATTRTAAMRRLSRTRPGSTVS